MAEDDAERQRSAPDEPPTAVASPRGKRQRAADLFSPHRYRALQLSAFERRAAQSAAAQSGVPFDDDLVDPPLSSNAPAAEAARAHMTGVGHPASRGLLSPVDAADEPSVANSPDPSFPFPYDEVGDPEEAANVPLADADLYLESGGADVAEAPDEDVTARTESLDMPPSTPIEAAEGTAGGEPVLERTGGKSGRNMPVAAAVGLLLLAVTVGAAYVHPLAFAALLYTFAVGAVIEWKRALERHGRRLPVVPLIAATIGLGVATNYGKAEGLVVALLVGCAGVVAWRIGDERIENTLADSLAGVLTLLWIPFLASFLFLLELADDGWERVIIVVLAVVGNDTGALAAGVRFGRHKLLPRVSPAKTWEGAIGGLVLGTVVASIAAYFFFDGEWYIGSAVGAACAVAAVIGDLAESALKRDIQVKDMSTALPGHGGILDRIDSLLFAAPVGYVVFAMFLGTLGGGGL